MSYVKAGKQMLTYYLFARNSYLSFTEPHVIQNLYAFLSFMNVKDTLKYVQAAPYREGTPRAVNLHSCQKAPWI